jgi:sugar phosphate isomerase/epimerase
MKERSIVTPRIRIGNQTAISCADPLEPFHFALLHRFDAFEWFADKKENTDGSFAGWDETDMDADLRAWIRQTGTTHKMLFTVHAPWQANPLHADGIPLLIRSIEFARDIGAALVNLHLYMDDGPQGYARALEPVLRHAAAAGLRVSIENTPHTTPDDFNETFDALAEQNTVPAGTAGMCLDIGHANLCAATHNHFIRYLEALSPTVPIIHLHAHENHGDRDSHLTLFTGPSREDDSGIRALVERLYCRRYRGAVILEQWPHPPELLVEAAVRLRTLLDAWLSTPLDRLKADKVSSRPSL